MIYKNSTEINKLEEHDIIIFNVDEENIEYKISHSSYSEEFYLIGNNTIYTTFNVLKYLNIIDINKFVENFNCIKNSITYNNINIDYIVSTNLEDLTLMTKELMVINEKINKKYGV